MRISKPRLKEKLKDKWKFLKFRKNFPVVGIDKIKNRKNTMKALLGAIGFDKMNT